MKQRLSILMLGVIVLAAACSTNPVTGKREISLISQGQELEIGRQAHADILNQFGVYDEKPELNRMVDRIGKRIAAISDRPDLPWTFTLLDTPMINAMALPGGYIYVTRGILERMNSEDELAGVLAHEIAHVTARHAVQRISQAQLAQFGLLLGSVLAGPAAAQSYGGLAELGAQLLFQRYSRQQETQSDLLGTAYMAEAGFNPKGAGEMLTALRRLNKELSSVEQYFVSHPDPRKRINDVEDKLVDLASANPAILQRAMERNSFVRDLEGMITGHSTLRTTIKNNTVYQRKYGMIVPVPSGWEATTATGGLFAILDPRQKNAGFTAQEVPLKVLAQSGGRDAQDAVRRALQSKGLRYIDSQTVSTRTGERFVVDLWAAQVSRSSSIAVETTQFVDGDQAVIFMQLTPKFRRGDSPMARTLQNMRFDRAEARSVEPPRMKVGDSRGSSDWRDVSRRATGNPSFAEAVANINGFDLNTRVPAGTLLKLPQQVIPEK